jgi:hypothetical protein
MTLWPVRALAGAVAALLAACSGPEAVRVSAAPVALEPGRPAVRMVGELAFAGGWVLEAKGVRRFGGLSDLEWLSPGRFELITDRGDAVELSLPADGAGRPDGDGRARIWPLAAARCGGGPGRKDAEDLAAAPGLRLVSFERDHRIVEADRCGPRLPFPPLSPELNHGIEALAFEEGEPGPSRYVAGAEDGRLWRCGMRPGEGCELVYAGGPPDGRGRWALRSLDGLAGRGALVGVWRQWTGRHGRVAVTLFEPDARGGLALRTLAVLDERYSIDNFEGISAEPRPGGGWRFWLVSDDNFSARQRTLLMAFDWSGRPET